MFFNSVIFDLDDTLYDYDSCHKNGLMYAIEYLHTLAPETSIFKIEKDYDKISHALKDEVGNAASSHNKLIYFKQLLKCYDISLKHLTNLHNIYWDGFYEHMELYPGFKDLLDYLVNRNIKCYILSNYTLNEQVKKLERLDVLNYFHDIFTSEEIGNEKPSIKTFLYAIHKIGQPANKIIMIGDDFTNDISGAINSGLFAYHINYYVGGIKHFKSDKFISFNNFEVLLKHFKELDRSLYELTKLSRMYGQRFDLIQATGGNISVKFGDDNKFMVVKSSGVALADVSRSAGYSIINNDVLKNEMFFENILNKSTVVSDGKPSMETYMHSILKKYTVHLHPANVNIILTRQNAAEEIKKFFPDSLFIKYVTPGLELAEELLKNYNNQSVIFLQNHGVIFTGDTINELKELVDCTVNKENDNLNITEEFTESLQGILSDFIIDECGGDENTVILSPIFVNDESYLSKYVFQFQFEVNKSLFPDKPVILGNEICSIPNRNIADLKDGIKNFISNNNGMIPKVIILKNELIYFVGTSLKECQYMYDIFATDEYLKSKHYEHCFSHPVKYLTIDEVSKLLESPEEKYRKGLLS